MEMTVMRPGMLTTVQDLGRPGHRSSGVPSGGAADSFSLRVANLLVGNPEDAAGLEFTLVGPVLRFPRDALIAIGGGGGALPRWQPLQVRAGEEIDFGALKNGCRQYLAIAGGIAVPPVLGSRSTYLPAGFGGVQGRALRAGDAVPIGDSRAALKSEAGVAKPKDASGSVLEGPHWHVDARFLPDYSGEATLRVIKGAQAAEFPPFSETRFRVTPQADRMGLRLEGAGLARAPAADLRSAPVTPGTVQVPPDGKPIILLADAQTIGGYPKLGHVISADLGRAAQLRPGDSVRLTEVSREEAQRGWLARERALGMLKEGLAAKFVQPPNNAARSAPA
jgi:antagonist of KipI